MDSDGHPKKEMLLLRRMMTLDETGRMVLIRMGMVIWPVENDNGPFTIMEWGEMLLNLTGIIFIYSWYGQVWGQL